MMKKILFASLFLFLIASACKPSDPQTPLSKVEHSPYTQNAVIYEVNVRQYTPEGTFKAFQEQLPRLAEQGIDILWFMPIHPIGMDGRKGSLGSYYSVRDYYTVNPEYGTMEDFKAIIEEAHSLGMKVVLDWVANHTSRDAVWVEEHPSWYERDSTGALIGPYDWTDVALLDYNNPQMQDAMEQVMLYWICEIGIDGYRCDVASEVPVEFWDRVAASLRAARKDFFFLAEAEMPELQMNAFDAYYGWGMHAMMNAIVSQKVDLDSLRRFVANHKTRFPSNSICMNFTSNHDENSWNGSEFRRMGKFTRLCAAFTFALPGMPMLYSGQEAGNTRELRFFERDTIDWSDKDNFSQFYKELIDFRDAHQALYAPTTGAPMQEISTTAPAQVYAFQRVLPKKDAVLSLFNFSSEDVEFKLTSKCFAKEKIYKLPAYGYQFVTE